MLSQIPLVLTRISYILSVLFSNKVESFEKFDGLNSLESVSALSIFQEVERFGDRQRKLVKMWKLVRRSRDYGNDVEISSTSFSLAGLNLGQIDICNRSVQ